MQKKILPALLLLLSAGLSVPAIAHEDPGKERADKERVAAPRADGSVTHERRPDASEEREKTSRWLRDEPGSNQVDTQIPEVAAECRPSSEHCPMTESSGASETEQAGDGTITSTDSLPLGSTVKRGNGPTVDESDYPTSVGSGSAGSGVTGTPVGPDQGPTLGIGR